MTEVAFTVIGRPQPAGSKRAFNHPSTGKVIVVDDAKHSRSWKQEVAAAAQHAFAAFDLPACSAHVPVELDVTFVLARPKGHFGTGRRALDVRASAPLWPTVRPDVDKLSRAVMDALKGIVYHDDSQVVRKTVEKLYGVPERCVVVARPMTATVGAVPA